METNNINDPSATDIDAYCGVYGNEGTYGILTDHLGRIQEHGGITGPTGKFAGFPGKGTARRILCSEIIEIRTEDGISDGRCGIPVRHEAEGACVGHAAIIASWRSLSEIDRACQEMAEG